MAINSFTDLIELGEWGAGVVCACWRGSVGLANLRARNHNWRCIDPCAGLTKTDQAERTRMARQELSESERAEMRLQIERLREEHRDLDAAIEALDKAGAVDRLQMQRIKKRKLALRDRLMLLEDLSTPNIIA